MPEDRKTKLRISVIYIKLMIRLLTNALTCLLKKNICLLGMFWSMVACLSWFKQLIPAQDQLKQLMTNYEQV